MKKTILTLFAIAIAFANTNAQVEPDKSVPRKTPEERAENMTKRISKELSLKPEQEVKIKTVILKREKERDEMMKDKKSEMDKINAEFKTILTAEQFQQFEKKRDEMIQKRKEKRMSQHDGEDGHVPPPAPEGK